MMRSVAQSSSCRGILARTESGCGGTVEGPLPGYRLPGERADRHRYYREDSKENGIPDTGTSQVRSPLSFVKIGLNPVNG